jgi:hypothetical protein
MGWFTFFKNNAPGANSSSNGNGTFEADAPDVSKEMFTDEADPEAATSLHSSGPARGIEAIYAFLQSDFEAKGYNDALTSPDDSYKADNIRLIKMDLQILIQKVNTYYEDLMKELDFHIQSRSRAGLVDLVEELKTRKQMASEHMAKVAGISSEMQLGSGMTQRIILSYQRGFMRGLSALTQSNVLNKKL